MFASALPHRLFLLALAVVLFVPTSAFAYDASRCLDQAVRDRTEDLEDAYDDYNEILERQLDRFDSVERNAYKEVDDLRYRYGEVYRGQYSYASQIQEANRNLNNRIQQVWNDYSSRIALCSGQDYYNNDYLYDRNYSQPYNYYEMYPTTHVQRSTYRYPSTRTYTKVISPPDSYRYGVYPTYQTHYTTHPYTYGSSYYNNSYYTYPTSRRDWCKMPTLRNDPGCGYTCTVGRDGCYECSQYCY
ncbi:MAG: hypothetical protein ABL890_04240 [Candidatus Peribacteraceae bacterium]